MRRARERVDAYVCYCLCIFHFLFTFDTTNTLFILTFTIFDRQGEKTSHTRGGNYHDTQNQTKGVIVGHKGGIWTISEEEMDHTRGGNQHDKQN